MRAGTAWRWAANSATLLNAVCGAGAITYVLLGNKLFALFLILAGVGFDGLDGLFSRRSGRPGTTFGRVADSCADAVTFCVAPGVALAYDHFAPSVWVAWGPVALTVGAVVAVVGLVRLVYFTTVTYSRKHFSGSSTPQNAMMVILLLLLFQVPGFVVESPPLVLFPALALAPVMLLPLPYPKTRRGSPLRSVTAAMAACLSLSLVLINFTPVPGSRLYELAYTGAVVGFLLLAAFYLVGPLAARGEPTEKVAPTEREVE